ncbi:hypothetical protein Q5H93_03155 [Hymenobacter sp. ASUV-10]|uniref:Uncharacterized protein n=1 Tax=Hymenobacter aranciens TaxID=3063996 RepID=A0ABT9B9K3_9BACT|nr:hypothetical protein [Hymenobacter sp. ASUV-10]MDO7873717.1 hypothetical protein [Hymenobacter sp. ASUV-10]
MLSDLAVFDNLRLSVKFTRIFGSRQAKKNSFCPFRRWRIAATGFAFGTCFFRPKTT